KIIRELKLADHGLRIVERPFANFLPLPDGRSFRLGPTLEDTQRELARFSARDAERVPGYYRAIETAADALPPLALETPPDLGGRGAIGEAMAKEARSRGVEITTGAEVVAVRVKAGRATGVALADGCEIEARAVAAGVNPKLLYLRLVEPQALDSEFRSRIE